MMTEQRMEDDRARGWRMIEQRMEDDRAENEE